jgi:PBSX family phage terminase large subunit
MQIDLNRCFPESTDGSRGPLPKQQRFMNAAFDEKGPAYILYSGGVGSGKTLIGCITVLTMAFLHSGDYLICRLFNPELKLTTYKTFLEICPKELLAEHRVADQIIKIKSVDGGISNVIFRGLEEPDKHRSLNLNAAYIDEASQVSEEAFTLLQSRLRGKHYRKILCTTNPNGHSWLYRYWVKKDFGNDNAKKQFFSVHAPSTENLHLPEGYVQNMLDSWSEERIKREVMGSWDAFAGQIYNEFERGKHVIKPFRVPEEWTKFVGLDHGYRNPTCAIWCAMDYDGNIYAYREFYQAEWIIEEIVKGRKDTGQLGLTQLALGEKLEGIWVDPSTKADRGKESDYTTYLEYLPKDWSLIPANNEVANGIDRVKQYLKPDQRTGKPRLFIFETCSNLIEQMAQYRYEELTPGQEMNKNMKESPVKKDDHAVDALRYAMMSRPEEPKLADLKTKKRQEPTLSGSVQREFHQLKQKGTQHDIWKDYEYGKDISWDDLF